MSTRGPGPGALHAAAPAADVALGLEPVVVEPPTGAQAGTRFEPTGPDTGILRERQPHGPVHTRIHFVGPARRHPGSGVTHREVVVDGWRVEVELESASRAELRARAGQGGTAAAAHGPTEVRAIIPGRVLSVSVAAGDSVVAGQQLLVVEAMKMQNELRAPRDGSVERIAVEPGATLEVGDLLVVIS